MFTVSVVAVDQVGNPLNASIKGSFSSKSGNGHLLDSQVVQQTCIQCSILEYNVFTQDNSAQLHIYANGPCEGIGVSKKTLITSPVRALLDFNLLHPKLNVFVNVTQD